MTDPATNTNSMESLPRLVQSPQNNDSFSVDQDTGTSPTSLGSSDGSLPSFPGKGHRPWNHGPNSFDDDHDEKKVSDEDFVASKEQGTVDLTEPSSLSLEPINESAPTTNYASTNSNQASSSSTNTTSSRTQAVQAARKKRERSLLEAVVGSIFNPDEQEGNDDEFDNSEKTPLFGFQAKKGGNRTPPPLIDPKEIPGFEEGTSEHMQQEEHKTNPRVARAWQVLREKVQSGDLLLGRRFSGLDPNQRFAKRQEAQEVIREGIEFNMWHCFFIFLTFMALAIGAFSYVFDHWSFVDAVYFALVTCTTVGYGDLVPDSYAGRVFTCLYALSGVCFLGIALGILGNQVVEAQESAVEQTSTVAKKRLLSLFAGDHADRRKTMTQTEEEEELLAEHMLDSEQEAAKSSPVWQLLFHFMLIMMLLGIFAISVAQDPGVDANNNGEPDLFDAFYFSIVTATTVGFGDYSPVTQNGRVMAIIFIPIAVGAMGHFLSSVAETIMESRAEAVRTQLASRDLTVEDLEIMDANGDGEVTRAEFLEFMLVAMNKVDKDFIDELRQHFSHLDVDGTGILSKGDLIEQARQKLTRINRKLELSNYKHQLLAKAAKQRRLRRRSGRAWGGVGAAMGDVGAAIGRPVARLRNTLRGFSFRRFSQSTTGVNSDRSWLDAEGDSRLFSETDESLFTLPTVRENENA